MQWKPYPESYFDGTRQHETAAMSYTILFLKNGTLYSVRVRATNNGGETWGRWSQIQIAVPEGTPAPRGFKTQWPTQTSITMRWWPVEGTTEHILEYRKSVDGQSPSAGDWSGVTRVTGHFDHLPIEDRTLRPLAVAAGLDCGTLYDFRLRARTTHRLHEELGGLSPYVYTSEETGECAQDERITNLLVTVAPVAPDCATLTWTAPADGRAVGYTVSRYSNHFGAWTALPNGGIDAGQRYRDCSSGYGSTPGDRYVYRVKALTADGEEYAEVISSMWNYGPFSVPNAPRNIRLTVDNQNMRSMAWDHATDVWVTMVKAAREGRMRNSVVRDSWPPPTQSTGPCSSTATASSSWTATGRSRSLTGGTS